jgi:hypothetical protein
VREALIRGGRLLAEASSEDPLWWKTNQADYQSAAA